MKVRALIRFNDLAEDTLREKGEEFIVNKARYAQLQGTKWGNLVVEVATDDAPDETTDDKE